MATLNQCTLPEGPVSLGDLVGLAFRVFRRNLRPYVTTLVGPALFTSASITGMQWCFVHWAEGRSLEVSWFAIHMIIALGCVVILVFSQWEMALRSAGILRALLLDDTVYEEGYTHARKRQWAVMLVYGLGYLIPVVIWAVIIAISVATCSLRNLGLAGLVASIFFGFIEGLCMVGFVAFALLFGAICFVIVACEELSVSDTLRRGLHMAYCYRWRGSSFVCLLGVSVFVVCLALNLPLVGLEIFEGVSHGRSGVVHMPIYLRALEAACGTVLNIVSVAVVIIGTGLYYRDMLLRLEGQDIVDALRNLESQVAAGDR